MGDFESCRFDFRIDVKKGLTPSKRKKAGRRNYSYSTLFTCKVCGNLFENRPLLLAHKLIHNVFRCGVCEATFPKQSMLKKHIAASHDGAYVRNKLSPLLPKIDGDLAAPDVPTPYVVAPLAPPSASVPSQFVCVNMPVLISPNDMEHDRCPDMITDVMTQSGVVMTQSGPVMTQSDGVTDVAPHSENSPGGCAPNGWEPVTTIKCEPDDISLPLTTDLSRYQYDGDDDLEPGEIRRGRHNEVVQRFVTSDSCLARTMTPNDSLTNMPQCDTQVQSTDSVKYDEWPQQSNDAFRITNDYINDYILPDVKQESPAEFPTALLYDISQDLPGNTAVSDDHISVIPAVENSFDDYKPDVCSDDSGTSGHCVSPPLEEENPPLDCSESEQGTSSQKHNLRMDVFRCEMCGFQGQYAHELAYHSCRQRRPARSDLNQMVERLWKTKMRLPVGRNTNNNGDAPMESVTTEEAETAANITDVSQNEDGVDNEMCVDGGMENAVAATPVPKKKRRQRLDYCTNKFHTCKFCRQLFDSAEKVWEHMVTHSECRRRGKVSLSSFRYTMLQRLKAMNATTDKPVTQPGVAVAQNTDDAPHRFACVYRGCSARYASHTDLMQHVRCHQTVSCDYPGCTKTFHDWRHLKRHRTIHTGEKPLGCSLCSYSCRHRSSMNWHMKSKHGLAKTKTNGNRTVYIDSDGNIVDGSAIGSVTKKTALPNVENGLISSDIDTQLQINTEDEGPIDLSMKSLGASESTEFLATAPKAIIAADVECDSMPSDCQVAAAVINVIPTRHLETTHESSGPEFYMSVMKFRYTNPKNHRVARGNGSHGDQKAYEGKYYTCKVCRQLFESAEQMWEHRACVHDEPSQFFCEHCGLEAENQFDLQSHVMETHGKEVGEFKDFLCVVCGKGYSSRTGLNNHMLVHSEGGAPKFVCPHPGCVARLHSKGALKNHIRRLHLKIQPRWQCEHDGCNRRFDTTSALRAHQVMHSDDRPLTCDFPGCDKSFRESKHLRVHCMQHTDERPLKCHLCEYSCRQRNSMNWHMKSKHQLYKCVTADGHTVYTPAQASSVVACLTR